MLSAMGDRAHLRATDQSSAVARMDSFLVHGTLSIFQHCTFQWSETLSGERTYVIEVGHCARCVMELRRANPMASLLPSSAEVKIARGTAPPDESRLAADNIVRMPMPLPRRRTPRGG